MCSARSNKKQRLSIKKTVMFRCVSEIYSVAIQLDLLYLLSCFPALNNFFGYALHTMKQAPESAWSWHASESRLFPGEGRNKCSMRLLCCSLHPTFYSRHFIFGIYEEGTSSECSMKLLWRIKASAPFVTYVFAGIPVFSLLFPTLASHLDGESIEDKKR